jgi:hypothetical protein
MLPKLKTPGRSPTTGAVLIFLINAAALQAQTTMAAGATHTIAPAGLPCLTNEAIVIDNPLLSVREGCDGARSALLIETGVTILPLSAHAVAGVKRVARFTVDDGSGTASGSWLPVHAAIPVEWIGRAFNDSLDPTDIAAYVAANSVARLRESTWGDPAAAGPILSEVSIQGLTHGGPNGCLSIPKGIVSAAVTAVKCIVGSFMKDGGTAHVDLVAVLQAGRTYNIEVDLQGELESSSTAGLPLPGIPLIAHPRLNFESGLAGEPFGLMISGDIRVTVGTSVGAELQELRNLIDLLRRDLASHTHQYDRARGWLHGTCPVGAGYGHAEHHRDRERHQANHSNFSLGAGDLLDPHLDHDRTMVGNLVPDRLVGLTKCHVTKRRAIGERDGPLVEHDVIDEFNERVLLATDRHVLRDRSEVRIGGLCVIELCPDGVA